MKIFHPTHLTYSIFLILHFFCDTVGFFSAVFASLWSLCPSVAFRNESVLAWQIMQFLYLVKYGPSRSSDRLMVIVNRVSEVSQLASRICKAKANATEVSMWNSLWRICFQRCFVPSKSILYGLIAFVKTCNRHRLSILNHLREYIRRTFHLSLPRLASSKGEVAENFCKKQS